MKNLLIRLALWVLKYCKYNAWGVEESLLLRTRQLCAEADNHFPPQYDEAKRHAVYAKLIKEFPHKSKGELADAIQVAVRHAR